MATYKFDATQESTITIKNVYTPDEDADKAPTGIEMLEGLEDVQMATGFASLGTPHIDEYDEKGKVLVAEKNGFKEAHAFSLRLFGGNQYITLFPGDEFKITAKGNAALYYAAINAQDIEVTTSPAVIDPTPYVPETIKVFAPSDEFFLDRGTGVGDESAIDFDSEAYTAEVIEGISA